MAHAPGLAAGRVRGCCPAGRRPLDDVRVRRGLQAAVLALAVFVFAVGAFGPAGVQNNLAPWAFFITFWVGLVPASLLAGPVWGVANPLRALHAGLARALRIDPRGVAGLPAWVGSWPAAASLFTFAWYELVFPHRDVPANVAIFLLVYAVAHVGAALRYGEDWFTRADGFEVYSRLLGSLAPLGRRPDGRLALRGPLEGLDTVRAAPGLTAVVVTLVGSTVYDGLTRTSWYNGHAPTGAVNATLMLASAVIAVALVYTAGTWTVATIRAGDTTAASATDFAHTLIPIAAGYAIAHYFSLFVFDGQQTFILASDPFGTGANYLGTAGHVVNYLLVSTRTIALVQIGAIVTGHVLAVAAAHDRAVRLFPYRQALRTQYPLLGTMVALTLTAVGLVLGG